jgi:hypothetical protein
MYQNEMAQNRKLGNWVSGGGPTHYVVTPKSC